MKRAKHIDTHFHFVRLCVKGNILETHYVPSEENTPDGFTKPLERIKFKRFQDSIGVKWVTNSH